jgi:hypothetical protein
LVGVGLKAKMEYDPSAWCTNRRARECSVFTIGKAMIDRLNCLPGHLLQMIRCASIEVGAKWG